MTEYDEMASLKFGSDPRDVVYLFNFHSNQKSKTIYYDNTGNRIKRRNFETEDDFEAEVEFVVLPSGDIISVAYGEWSLFSFRNEFGKEEQFVGRPKKVFFEDTKPKMEYEYFEKDLYIGDDFRRVEDLINDDNTVLPVKSYQGSLRIYNLDLVSLPKYRRSFALAKPWLRRHLFHELGFYTWKDGRKPNGPDVYDFLELFFISPALLWRTRLGEFMWNVILEPLELNSEIREGAMNATYVQSEETKAVNLCSNCGLHHATHEITTDPYARYLFDDECNDKFLKAHSAGQFLRWFRGHDNLSAKLFTKAKKRLTRLVSEP